jgi:hypothetical protein
MGEEVIDTDGQVLTKTTYANGTIHYLNTKGQYHRIGGPAVIYPSGSQFYWVNGKRHRTDGPAKIFGTGSQEYWVKGKLHRIEGPAIIHPDGFQFYYVDDVKYIKDEYPKAVVEYRLKQLVG